MSAILYQNYKGFDVNTHSYSAGQDFRQCRRLYKLKRLDGWRSREKRASQVFGECVESALQYFHANQCKPGSGVDEFKRLWLQKRELKSLSYTVKEGDWDDMYRMGADMLLLYEIRLPSLGFCDPKFQLNYKKVVFPGTEYAGIEFTSFIDMRATGVWKVRPEDNGPGAALGLLDPDRPIIIDIKTASATLDLTPNLLTLDPQLRSYAWVTGVPDVAFLWFVKSRPDSFKKGDRVTLLEATKAGAAGDEVLVLQGPSENDNIVTVVSAKDYTRFEESVEGLKPQTKAFKEKLFEFAGAHGAAVGTGRVTKQKLQFVAVHIPDEDMHEAGEQIGREIVEIVESSKHGSFPKEPSVRFPNQKCQFCDMLPICTRNEAEIGKTLVQLKPADEIEEMFA